MPRLDRSSADEVAPAASAVSPPATEPVPVPTGVTNTYPVRLAAAIQGLIPAVIAVLAAFDVWSPTDAQLGTIAGLYTALLIIVSEIAAGKVSSAATVARIRNGEA